MRIYMAGVYHTARKNQTESSSLHSRVSTAYCTGYPHILESYAYLNHSIVDALKTDERKIFLDSGAFTMFTQGTEVDLKRYAGFIKTFPEIIEVASNVDKIGAGQEQQTYDNQRTLEDLLGSRGVVPVHHVRDADKWLQRYIDDGYEYIALGGMVPESTPTLRYWLDHVWKEYLTNADGTPKIKVHGFGLTTLELMLKYPWFSVDSTAWVLNSRYGIVFMDLPRGGEIRRYKIDFSTRSPKKYEVNSWHYRSLQKDEQQVIDQRLAMFEAERTKLPDLEHEYRETFGHELGYNPDCLGECYGMRDAANVNYFFRAQDAGVERFEHAQETLF